MYFAQVYAFSQDSIYSDTSDIAFCVSEYEYALDNYDTTQDYINLTSLSAYGSRLKVTSMKYIRTLRFTQLKFGSALLFNSSTKGCYI